MTNYLLNLLTNGTPYEANLAIYAEIIDGEFRPESLACVVADGDDLPRNDATGLDMVGEVALFGGATKITDAMRDPLTLDWDSDVNPEDEFFGLNYPDNNDAFPKALLRDVCREIIKERNAALEPAMR